jgi:hypothetical protein
MFLFRVRIIDRALSALGKKPEPKPVSPILRFGGTVVIPARTARFVPKSAFVVNTKPGSRVKISYVDPDFIAGFGDKIEEPTGEASLGHHVLTRPSAFAPAVKELGDGGVIVKTTPGELYSMMEQQPDGPRSEAGPLLTNGYTNLFEMEDANGVSPLVYAHWHGGGWLVFAHPVTPSLEWNDGRQVFSRNSR